MSKVESYRKLIEQYGADAVAEALRTSQKADERPTLRPSRAGYKRKGVRRWKVIVYYISIGLSGEEIRERLGMSLDTFRTHMKKARRDLGCKTRPHLIAEAIRRGIIP